jgi:hypothetical protein
MPSRSEIIRARDRLQSATPICDDESLLKLEAKRSDHLRPRELVSTVVDGSRGAILVHPSKTSAPDACSASTRLNAKMDEARYIPPRRWCDRRSRRWRDGLAFRRLAPAAIVVVVALIALVLIHRPA